MKKMTEGLPRENYGMENLSVEENPAQKTVHASGGPRVCRLSGCKKAFIPGRRIQVFCSRCRSRYFKTARQIGIILMERINSDPAVRVFINKLLKDRNGRTS